MAVDHPDAAALADLRSTLKWLVSSAGATAAVLTAGLQLTGLHGLTTPQAITASLASAVAIGLALTLLTAATRVLATPRPTSTEISHREMNTPNATDPARIEPLQDPFVQWIHVNSVRLLGASHNVTEVCSRQLDAQRVSRELRSGVSSRWHDQTLEPNDPDAQRRVDAELQEASDVLAGVEAASHYYLTKNKFDAMMRCFPWGAGMFVGAVVLFAFISSSRT